MNLLTHAYALAKALATLDGKLDAFLVEASGAVGAGDLGYTGHFDGYIAEAEAIIEDLEAEGWIIIHKEPNP